MRGDVNVLLFLPPRALEEARALLRDAPRSKKHRSAFFEDEARGTLRSFARMLAVCRLTWRLHLGDSSTPPAHRADAARRQR